MFNSSIKSKSLLDNEIFKCIFPPNWFFIDSGLWSKSSLTPFIIVTPLISNFPLSSYTSAPVLMIGTL